MQINQMLNHNEQFIMEQDAPLDPHLETIIQVVTTVFGLSKQEMMVSCRSYEVWKPRMAAMFLARTHTDLSLTVIGEIFGGRSHTTVLRACRRCRALMDKDQNWADLMANLLSQVATQIKFDEVA